MIATTLLDTKGMFGPKGAVDSVGHLIGAASAWGGNPEKDALYLNVAPAKNDGNTVYRLNVKDVPIDGFWSISVYNAKGFFEPNPQNAYTLNNIAAKANADGRFPFSSAAATAMFRTAFPSCRAGATWCGSIGRAPRFWMDVGLSRKRNRPTDRRRGRSARPPAAPATNFPKVAKAVSRSHLNGGCGADFGPPQGDPSRPALRPLRTIGHERLALIHTARTTTPSPALAICAS